MWTIKYRPRKLKEVVGQKGVVDLEKWFENWKPGKKVALLWGDPGVGKTASVYALADEKNLELIEINASDVRNASGIREVIGESVKQRSLLNRRKIILIDEVDGISGTSDRGGLKELIKIIKETKYPIVITANDAYDKKLQTLRNYCVLIKFGKVHLTSMVKRLEEICKKEGIECDKNLLKRIGRQAGGDMRAAINDLEAIASGKKKITDRDLDVLGYREKSQEIFEVLKVIFKTKTIKNSIDMISNSDKDPEEIFWWIEENITNEYEDPEEVAKAYDALSKADIFRRWVKVRQNWRFRRYMIDIMCGGVSLAKKEMYRKFTRYNPPSRLVMYGGSKGKRKQLNEVCKRIGEKVHTSSRVVIREYLPFFKFIFENKNWKNNIKDELDLEDEDIEMLTKL